MFTLAGLTRRTDHRDRAAPESSIENIDGTGRTRQKSHRPRRTGPLLSPLRPQFRHHDLGLRAVERGQMRLVQPFHRRAAETVLMSLRTGRSGDGCHARLTPAASVVSWMKQVLGVRSKRSRRNKRIGRNENGK